MDIRVWRDEFYGSVKADRMLNLDVTNGELQASGTGGSAPQLIFTSIMGDENYTTTPKAYFDAGGPDYLSNAPYDFGTKGTSGVDTADVDGDGFFDVVFSVHRTGGGIYSASSPLFMGGPLGIKDDPAHLFGTTGASDVVLADLNDDGYVDVVFSQEMKAMGDYEVNSTLFWGSADGWSDTPDVEFLTDGAWDVEAVDLDGDDLLDLVFACYMGDSTSTDSMVFMQEATGFNGTKVSYRLPTKGAKAVASGDIDGDSLFDLVFANSFSAGFAEVDSYVYWGRVGGGFEATPGKLATVGAADVEVADLNGDTNMDVVFANYWDNAQDHGVESFVYMGDGSRNLITIPTFSLPTSGATAVTVTDLDGTGWKDLVFACEQDGTTYQVPSVAYLGGGPGYVPTPSITIPTQGASDVIPADLIKHGSGGYMSNAILLDMPPRDTGGVHTFRYTATLGASHTARVQLVDAATWEVLGETSIQSSTNEWDVRGLFRVKEHPTIRVVIVADGLETAGTFSMDDLWLNWTKRVPVPPEVLDLGFTGSSVFRTQEVGMWINVTDDYDLPEELVLQMEHRVNGTDTWEDYLLGSFTFEEASGSWKATVNPKVQAVLGVYDFRVSASDLDSQFAEWMEFPNVLEVLNNLPTTPVVHITLDKPVTTSTLAVEFDARSSDIETPGLTYNFTWYRNGVLVPEVTGDQVPTYLTSKGENWTVEVRAWDGDEMSMPGIAWVTISNTPPSPKDVISDPELEEDTVDADWINLSNAFQDNDGDPIEWSVGGTPEHMTVEIDHDTGTVTITPDEHWFGNETITFVASDGEFHTSQTVTVMVLSVNDYPWIATVDGEPVVGDALEYTVGQGGKLVITYTTQDIEGDEVQAEVSAQTVVLDEAAGTITFEPGDDAVGTFTFTLRIWDVESPDTKVSLSFTIEVLNENDPMDDPMIGQPMSGAYYKVNQSFSLVGYCEDPDIRFGQELEFIWTSNISGELGRGSSITARLLQAGTHRITLTVRDPDYEKTTSIELHIEPRDDVTPPPPDDDVVDPGTNWAIVAGIVIALVIMGVVLFVATGKRRTEAYEERMDAEEQEEEKKEALERTAQAIKDVADQWEAAQVSAKAQKATDSARTAALAEGWELEEIELESTEGQLSMEASVTEAPSDDVQNLWVGVTAPAVESTEEDREALRIENLKRKYQNTIGRLPYGIPSKELADRDWVDLANALVTGEKRTLPDGRETTEIDGRWYYSDPDDTGTFLKEHGAKPKEGPKRNADATTDKGALLAKLEERFILGEISEETYKALREKYGK